MMLFYGGNTMKYDICFDVSALIFIIIAMLSTARQRAGRTRQNVCFGRLLRALLAALILDITGAFFINYSAMIPVEINMPVNAAGFIAIAFTVYSYAMYMEAFIREEAVNRTFHLFTVFVFAAYVAAHIVNIFTGFIFYFDGELVYTRGRFYLAVYAVPMYFFIYGVILLCANRKHIETRQFTAGMSLVPFITVGTALQFSILSHYYIILFAVTLAVMVIFFNLETPDCNKLEAALHEADSANKAKGDFLANMSHEIRTPMNAIVGMCELILREQDISDQVREYCFNIQSSGRSLLSVINDILDFSKIESGRMELIEDEFNIASTLNDVINMAVARKGDKRLEMIVHIDPDIPAGLIGDEIRIRQIIINLVTNAIKYTSEGCICIRVSQTKHDYGINLSVSVSDTGIGITEENLEKLFSSFQQVDTKKNRAVEGTGLGLAISKRLISQMGGFINVYSEYGKGSEFRFVIPLRVANDAPFISVKNAENIRAAGYIDFSKFNSERIADEYRCLISEMSCDLHTNIRLFESMEELKAAFAENKYNYLFAGREEYCAEEEFFTAASETCETVLIQDQSDAIDFPERVRCLFKPFYALSAAAVFNHENIITNMNERRNHGIRFSAPQARVLIVDDNPINLKVAVGLMRPYHMQVVTAESAEAAVSMLRSKDFHIVFMDHMMPVTDGVEATKIIRSMDGEYYSKLPIIALTANAVNGVREMFVSAGMNDFIAKPIELSALDRVLKLWLPKELIKAPMAGEIYPGDRRRPQKPAEGNELFSPETGIFYTGGDTDSYHEILEMYVRKSKEKQNFIQKLFDERSWKNYIIEVHALKSSSLSIGSKLLSEKAKELELAGKAGNYKLIEKKNAALMELYRQVSAEGEKYLAEKGLLDEPETAPSAETLPQMTTEALEELIGKIKAACDSFDGDEIAALCGEAAGFSYGSAALGTLFDEVKAAADDFEYDEAAQKASLIAEKLKGGE